MTERNVYAPPQAEVRDPVPESGTPASRGLRFLGSLVDGVIALVVTVPLGMVTGYWSEAFAGEVSFAQSLAISIAAFMAFVGLHGYWLAKHGQTIGKRVVGTRIVNADDEQLPSFQRLLALRYGVVSLASLIPVAGSFLALIDVLFIFRADRRCLHDLIAGTKVIRA